MADPASTDPKPPHPGERLASYFENFFRTVVGIAVLGASITFAKIIQSPVSPFHPYGFSATTAQYMLALSWLLFVLALAFTSFFASALSLWRPQAVKAFGTAIGKDRTKVLWISSLVSALLLGLLVTAFIFLSLIVVVYAGPVGWVATAFTIIFGVLGFGTIAWQSPLEWPTFKQGSTEHAFDKHMRIQGLKGQGDNLTARPSQRSGRSYVDEKDGAFVQGRYDDERYGSQRRTGTIGTGSGRYGRYNRASSGVHGGLNIDRYSKASTMVPDVYDGGRLTVYDDGIREGMATYDRSYGVHD